MTQLAIRSDAETRAQWVNATGDVTDDDVLPKVREIASALQTWVNEPRRARHSSMFDRKAYVAPDNIFEQMRIARKAVEDDDIVGGAAEVTEGLVFQGIKWEGEESDVVDVFNQISRDLDLDSIMRAAYREEFTYSQFVMASWWSRKTYRVRGYNPPKEQTLEAKTDPATGVVTYEPPRDKDTNQPEKPERRGTRRRQEFSLYVPTRLTILDSARVVPVGHNLWGAERLAWQATQTEMKVWEELSDFTDDLTMSTLVIGKYTPPKDEEIELVRLGVDTKNLLELNPERVWRHTMTRPSYQKWADLRLKGVFRLLDLKAQLMEADRVNLVGAANYILLVKKGSKDEPAYPEEISNLKEGMTVLAKLPVIISDHRLEIEIITPKLDMTLQGEKYDTLDRRIMQRLLGALTLGSSGQRNESTLTIGRMIARMLENRRHMLKRFIEREVARRIMDVNKGVAKFEEEPNLVYTPRNVQLDSDQQIVQAIVAANARGDLSRHSFLEFFGFDEEVEAQWKLHEEESGLDDIFQTHTPFDSPLNGNAGGMPPGAFGAQGGRPTGGGAPTKNAAQPGKGKS